MSNDVEAKVEANAQARERLSVLVDGELDSGLVAQACGLWRDDAEARATWHAYHLIGDVLRSDDLAVDPTRDAAFVDILRTRLAREPIVFAPQPLAQSASVESPIVARATAGVGRRRSWLAPTAIAAGFVAVAGVLTLTRSGVLSDRAATESVAQIVPAAARAAGTVQPAELQTIAATGAVIRDARLDRYLAAHKQFASSSALGVPSAYLRNATVDVSGR